MTLASNLDGGAYGANEVSAKSSRGIWFARQVHQVLSKYRACFTATVVASLCTLMY